MFARMLLFFTSPFPSVLEPNAAFSLCLSVKFMRVSKNCIIYGHQLDSRYGRESLSQFSNEKKKKWSDEMKVDGEETM